MANKKSESLRKQHNINVRLDKKDYSILKMISTNKKLSLSDTIRKCLRDSI